jgi:Zn-dependent M28 family amino/carboxypeptidase
MSAGWPRRRVKVGASAPHNASGVAALLELARVLADSRPERTLIFAAFSGEEAGLLGSREFVRQAQQPGAPWQLTGMLADLNLDTVGRLDGGSRI